jgi:hypothetical protein
MTYTETELRTLIAISILCIIERIEESNHKDLMDTLLTIKEENETIINSQASIELA